MNNIDLAILAFLSLSIFIGLVRGVSGEIGAIVKISITIFVGYMILDFLGEKLNSALFKDIFFPTTIYTVTYILVSFFAKLIINPIIFFLRSIIPFIIDKFLGVMAAGAKAFLIISVMYNLYDLVATALNIEKLPLLEDSYSSIILDETSHLTYPIAEKLNPIKDLENNNTEDMLEQYLNKTTSEDPESLEKNDKLESIKNLMRHYENLQIIEENSKQN